MIRSPMKSTQTGSVSVVTHAGVGPAMENAVLIASAIISDFKGELQILMNNTARNGQLSCVPYLRTISRRFLSLRNRKRE